MSNTPQEEPIPESYLDWMKNEFPYQAHPAPDDYGYPNRAVMDISFRSAHNAAAKAYRKLSQKAAPEPKRIAPEKPYFVAQCEGCGFKAASSEWLGGGQIADTGDYGDTYCPVCGHVDCEEAENDAYIDQHELLVAKIKEFRDQAEIAHYENFELRAKLAAGKAATTDGSETADEKNYRKLSEWYLKQLRECQSELRTLKAAPGMRKQDIVEFATWLIKVGLIPPNRNEFGGFYKPDPDYITDRYQKEHLQFLTAAPSKSIEEENRHGMRFIPPPTDDAKTYYTYFLIEFEDCGIPEYDYTICETLGDIGHELQIAETSFDDDTIEAKAVITGIVLTKDELAHWKKTYQLPSRFHGYVIVPDIPIEEEKVAAPSPTEVPRDKPKEENIHFPEEGKMPAIIVRAIDDYVYFTPILPKCHEMSKEEIWFEGIRNGAEFMYNHSAGLWSKPAAVLQAWCKRIEAQNTALHASLAEKELVISGIEEGAEQWKAEYENLKAILKNIRPWPLIAYAPGNYQCECCACKKKFNGDKRAVMCLECAISETHSRVDELEASLVSITVERGAYRKALEEIKEAELNTELGLSGKGSVSFLISQNALEKHPSPTNTAQK